MSAAERLNNAIVKLDWVTPSEPAGRKKAVADLAEHWLAWWASNGRSAHSLRNAEKLQRYAAWYARAWWMVGEKTRAKAPDPRGLEVTWAAVVSDELGELTRGAEAAADVGQYAKDVARKLKSELEAARDATLWTVLLAFAKAKR